MEEKKFPQCVKAKFIGNFRVAAQQRIGPAKPERQETVPTTQDKTRKETGKDMMKDKERKSLTRKDTKATRSRNVRERKRETETLFPEFEN